VFKDINIALRVYSSMRDRSVVGETSLKDFLTHYNLQSGSYGLFSVVRVSQLCIVYEYMEEMDMDLLVEECNPGYRVDLSAGE
jgi:hypothetical protein